MSDFYQVSRADLEAINKAMNHMGDVLNGMDAVEEEDEVATEAGFKAIQAILASHPSNAAGQDAPTERDIVEMCEKAGLWSNTVHNWIEPFKRYNAELLKRFAAPAAVDVRDAALPSVTSVLNSIEFELEELDKNGALPFSLEAHLEAIRALQSPPQGQADTEVKS